MNGCPALRKGEKGGMLASRHETTVVILNSQTALVDLPQFSTPSGLATTFLHHDWEKVLEAPPLSEALYSVDG